MRPANPLASRGAPDIKTPNLVPERKVPNGVEYDSKPDAAPDARVPDTAAGNRGPGGSVESPQGSASGGFQAVSTGTKRVSPATTANIDMSAPTMGGACFLAGTVVETQDGLRAIETVEVGQWVAGRNEASGKTTWRRVVQTFRTENMQALAVDVRHADGEIETIQTTTEHPFYVQDKSWCEARELSAGDRLVLIDNTLSTVVAVEPIAGLHVVYNFEVEVDHTYFVGGRGIWVHNTCRIDWANVRRANGDGTGVPTGRTQGAPANTPAVAPTRPAGPDSNNNATGTGARQLEVAITHKTGNRQVVADGQRWNVPKDLELSNIPARDPVGNKLQDLASEAGQRWNPKRNLSAAEKEAMKEARGLGEHWRANLLEQQAKGRWVENEVKIGAREASLRAPNKTPCLS